MRLYPLLRFCTSENDPRSIPLEGNFWVLHGTLPWLKHFCDLLCQQGPIGTRARPACPRHDDFESNHSWWWMMHICSDEKTVVCQNGSKWMDFLDCLGTLWLPLVRVSRDLAIFLGWKLCASNPVIPALLRQLWWNGTEMVNLPLQGKNFHKKINS